ncbi:MULTISPECIES: class I SAM-dependent methyltransferase [Mycolicibacterium]|nr:MULTISPECIES: class I SAM-dependent methyltransferase [Mycolicibacterium]MCV7338662.1 class I SAM-dependent methyltransferase [Mycolicibacterium senegalense]MCW1822252.1 class I SAM-dependent methyltransferase [Mycolicibacterium senegalense]MDR7289633.1 ubiquinone/menaquinone biosynthesis C-methylase UbiE [Mycolicibacterium senegalense]OBB09199.1 methyltransferase type 11 [Mycolicibacterium conceptionense]OBF05985.1 methyltransferase type 11 [Mycolicibacterium conceptionense]
MPAMSQIERAFCKTALWRGGTGQAVLGSLPLDRLGHDVLEIGSGSGDIAARLRQANPDLAITATDFDPAMVRTAARRLQAYPEVTVRGADATDLPFSADSFDSVLSCLMLHHIVEWERAIAEIARVLRPGGVFTGYDLTRTPMATAIHRLDRSPFRLVNPDELEEVCARHGLAVRTRTRLAGQVMQFSSD